MNTGITAKIVIKIHDEELINFAGFEGVDETKLEGAISRVDQYIAYSDDDKYREDVFVIASLYLVAIAKAHAFNDGNKRTALVAALTFLKLQGINLPRDCGLDDFMVSIAASTDDHEDLVEVVANCLYDLAEQYNQI